MASISARWSFSATSKAGRKCVGSMRSNGGASNGPVQDWRSGFWSPVDWVINVSDWRFANPAAASLSGRRRLIVADVRIAIVGQRVCRGHARANNRPAASQKGGRHKGVDDSGRIESLIAIPSSSRTNFRRASIRSTTAGWRAFSSARKAVSAKTTPSSQLSAQPARIGSRNDVDLKRHARRDALGRAWPNRRMNPLVVAGEVAWIEGRLQGAARERAPNRRQTRRSPRVPMSAASYQAMRPSK